MRPLFTFCEPKSVSTGGSIWRVILPPAVADQPNLPAQTPTARTKAMPGAYELCPRQTSQPLRSPPGGPAPITALPSPAHSATPVTARSNRSHLPVTDSNPR